MVHAYPPHHNAGGEMTMHTLLRRLVERGHDVHAVLSRPDAAVPRDYALDGVQVHRHVDAGDPMPYFIGSDTRAGVVIAHLENTLRAAALASIYHVPMVHLIHNDHAFTKGAFGRGPTQLAVFNSNWMRAEYATYWEATYNGPMPPSVVVHPPVIGKDYATKHGSRVTLINLSEAKGGELLWRLAQAMPEVKFLGIEGAYGEQINKGPLDNVVVYGHLPPEDMAPVVYGQTKILLMPSSYESYGRTAVEASYSGIPTIAHPTPGLKEALGDAGTFVDRDDLDGWVKAIKHLYSPRGYSAASRRATALAASLDPDGDLDRFADAMEGVVRRGFATAAR